MKRLLLLAVTALVLVLAPEASAKMCVTITTVPAQPVAGAPTTIRVTAWLPGVVDGKPRWGDRRAAVSEHARINIRVFGPNEQRRLVPVRRLADHASVLEGRFTFPSSGVWSLRWSAFTLDSACAGTLRVRVGGR